MFDLRDPHTGPHSPTVHKKNLLLKTHFCRFHEDTEIRCFLNSLINCFHYFTKHFALLELNTTVSKFSSVMTDVSELCCWSCSLVTFPF